VSYVAILHPADGSSLLVDHINAGLWLPPGGHVEPGEHPAATARREIREELAIEPVFIEDAARLSFITVTRTTGTDRGHLDVSLWFLLVGERGMPLTATGPSSPTHAGGRRRTYSPRGPGASTRTTGGS